MTVEAISNQNNTSLQAALYGAGISLTLYVALITIGTLAVPSTAIFTITATACAATGGLAAHLFSRLIATNCQNQEATDRQEPLNTSQIPTLSSLIPISPPEQQEHKEARRIAIDLGNSLVNGNNIFEQIDNKEEAIAALVESYNNIPDGVISLTIGDGLSPRDRTPEESSARYKYDQLLPQLVLNQTKPFTLIRCSPSQNDNQRLLSGDLTEKIALAPLKTRKEAYDMFTQSQYHYNQNISWPITKKNDALNVRTRELFHKHLENKDNTVVVGYHIDSNFSLINRVLTLNDFLDQYKGRFTVLIGHENFCVTITESIKSPAQFNRDIINAETTAKASKSESLVTETTLENWMKKYPGTTVSWETFIAPDAIDRINST